MLSHYRLIEKIGEGGMGYVYKALDTQLNRHVAIKFLQAELTPDQERRLRFRREAQAAAALDHPNVAVIYEVGEHEGNLFIVMQYLEGQPLGKVVGQRPLPLKEWLRLAMPIAEGLAHAHQHGIVHRDLKPDNVMITHEGQVKILDFGLAKLMEPEARPGGVDEELDSALETISRELTRAGKVLGTIAYMSPEQARGEAVDHRTDLFSFGVMLYEMASGERPFRGKSQVESLNATITQEPAPLSQVTGGIPTEVERVVRKAMEKEPERRYQDAADLAADLKNLKRDLDTGRTSIPSGAATALRWRPRWVIAAGIGLALLLIAGAGYLFYGQPADDAAVSQSEDRAIAVVGFENLNDPADSERLGRVLMGLITTDLAEASGLTVVSTPKVLAALRQVSSSEGFDAAVASDAARTAGAEVMVVGQVSKAGDRLILTAELIDVESGTTLTSQKREAASEAELFDLAGAIGAEVRERLGSGSEATFDLAEALTSSPEAYRHYAGGEIALHELRLREAIESFGRALKEDPTFALAYYRRAVAQDWYGDAEGARASLESGLPHIDRLPPRWQIVYRAYQEYNKDAYNLAYETLSALVESTTDIPDAHYILGEISWHAAHYRDVKKARKLFESALDIDPTYKLVLYHLIECFILGDDLASAKRLVERFRAEDPTDFAVVRAEVAILRAEGRIDEAIAKAEDSTLDSNERGALHLLVGNWERAFARSDEHFRSRTGYEAALGLHVRGLAQVGRGRIKEALVDLQKAAELTHGTVVAARGARFHVNRALLVEAVGDAEGAADAAREAVALEPYAFEGTFYLGRFLLGVGKVAEAEQALTRLEELFRESEAPGGEFWEYLLRAESELTKGNLKAADTALAQASSLVPEYRNRSAELETRARIREAFGDRTGAIAAYREIKPINRWAVVNATLALYELARLEDEAGDVASARQHYQEFLDRWGDADLPIPAVAKAKSRLAALASQ
jgi:tetratricopeptide (TPR) repeat protein/tRNA A-37 threonylcarbamoyl transferase component Bud32